MVFNAVAEVIEVIDGDTFHANLDIGWGIMLRPRRARPGAVRGIGSVRVVAADGSAYDAPERGTVAGRDARTFAQLLTSPGDRLRILSYDLDDFGRTLAAVTLPDGRDWAQTMTTAGFVKGKRP